MNRDRDEDRRAIGMEFSVLAGESKSATLAPGQVWTFGRSKDCSETLSLPALSRIALVVDHLDSGILRVSSRQSNMGRVLISSDDDREQHTIGLGSGPVHLAGGNYTLNVELPPIVLRMHVAVPHLLRRGSNPPMKSSPRRVAEKTATSWAPEVGTDEGREWIAVVALAVALSRYPELVPHEADSEGPPVKMSEALRQASGVWCGHTSHYWVNERLKEAITAADLVVPESGERLSTAVTHYAQFFSDPTIRELRDELLRLVAQAEDER